MFFLFSLPLIFFGQSVDVLFIGNSYTVAHNMPQMISNIALSLGDTVNYETSTIGGATFNLHSTNINTLSKISQKDWDYVVLQAQSQEPSFSPNQVANDLYPYAAVLIDSILSNSICTEPIFFMTWGRKYGDQQNCQFYPPICTYSGMQQRLKESYLDLAFYHHSSCAPVGMSWKESISQDSTLNLFSSDNSHPSIYGSYLAACTFYSTIFKESSIGSEYIPNGIDTNTAIFLQTIATNTVLDSLPNWNIFSADFTTTSIGNLVTFENTSSNFDNVIWYFGDGDSSTNINPVHTYSGTGSYNVSLVTFSSNGCLIDSANSIVIIYDLSSECDSFEVTDVIIDNINLSIDIGIYNGYNNFLTYPYVAFTIDYNGDTLQQGNINLFGAINYDTSWYNYSISNTINPSYPLSIYFVNYNDTCLLVYDAIAASSYNLNCQRKLLRTIDIFGRDKKKSENEILIYLYDDGTIEKRIIIQ